MTFSAENKKAFRCRKCITPITCENEIFFCLQFFACENIPSVSQISVDQSFFFFQNKVTEKFKRPFKKRHSSVYHQPTNRVNKFLSQAIEARSVDREKSVHVNRFTLRFRESDKEREYHQDLDLGFSTAMCCSLLLLILAAALQVCELFSNVVLSFSN